VVSEINTLFSDVQKAVEKTNLRRCYQCATCGGGCPVARLNPNFRPRVIFMGVSLGKKDILKDPKLWLCATCYACDENCPQDIKTTEFLLLLKNSAARASNLPATVKRLAEAFIRNGTVAPISGFVNKKREGMGLPAVPPVAKEEIQKIVRKTGFDRLVGYEW
jgi:heterodisulfide reductase subunit C